MADQGIAPLPAGPSPAEYFAARGLRSSSWSAGAGTWFPPHRHPQTKHLFVTRGSITFNGALVRAPEGVLIGAGTEHEALVGEAGVECAEGFEVGPSPEAHA
jgi:hypothetical protein